MYLPLIQGGIIETFNDYDGKRFFLKAKSLVGFNLQILIIVGKATF